MDIDYSYNQVMHWCNIVSIVWTSNIFVVSKKVTLCTLWAYTLICVATTLLHCRNGSSAVAQTRSEMRHFPTGKPGKYTQQVFPGTHTHGFCLGGGDCCFSHKHVRWCCPVLRLRLPTKSWSQSTQGAKQHIALASRLQREEWLQWH